MPLCGHVSRSQKKGRQFDEGDFTMTHSTDITKSNETWALANLLAGRYGRLALTRAAGEASAAQRQGDMESWAVWHSVVLHLRQTTVQRTADATT